MYREDAYHYNIPRRKAIDDDDTRSYNRAVRQRYERVERLIQQRLLKDPNGVVVSDRPLYSAYTFRFRSFVGDLQLLTPEIPPASWFKRRAACIFALFLFDASQRQQKRALIHWRSIISDETRIKHRFFDKWSVYAARRRLAKLNARRFVALTRPLVRKVVAAHLRCTWQTWQHFVEWRRLFVRIRLLFRCWKTVVHALRTRRRRLVQRGFDDWRHFQRRQQAALVDRLTALQQLQLKYTWRRWRAVWTQRRAVHRLVACLTRFCAHPWLQLYVAWNLWRHYGRRTPPPALLSPHSRTTSPRPPRSPASPPPAAASTSPLRRSGSSQRSPGPRRRHAANCIACAASYASPMSVSLSASSAFAALRGGICSETKPPPPPPPPPPPLPPQQAASLREKIHRRLERVKEADARFTANEDTWKEQHRATPSPSLASASRLSTPATRRATAATAAAASSTLSSSSRRGAVETPRGRHSRPPPPPSRPPPSSRTPPSRPLTAAQRALLTPSPPAASHPPPPATTATAATAAGDEGDADEALRRVLLAEFAEYLPADFAARSRRANAAAAAAGPVGYFDTDDADEWRALNPPPPSPPSPPPLRLDDRGASDDATDGGRDGGGGGEATWTQLLRPSVVDDDDDDDDASAAVAATPIAQLFPPSTSRPRAGHRTVADAAADVASGEDDRCGPDERRRFHATAPSSSVGHRYAPRHRRDASASRSTSPPTAASAAAAAAAWDEVYAPRLATSLTLLPMPQRSPSPTTPSPPAAGRAPRGGTTRPTPPPPPPPPQQHRGPRNTRSQRDTRGGPRATPATAPATRPSSGSRRR